METPKAITAVINGVVGKYPGNLARQKKTAKASIRRLPEYDDYVEGLVDQAVELLVYNCRHISNCAQKRSCGEYGQAARVLVAGSDSVRKAHSMYNYNIAGRTLGMLLGEELDALAETQFAAGNGCHVNARLLWGLAEIVPASKRVMDVVGEGKLNHLLKSAKQKILSGAA